MVVLHLSIEGEGFALVLIIEGEGFANVSPDKDEGHRRAGRRGLMTASDDAMTAKEPNRVSRMASGRVGDAPPVSGNGSSEPSSGDGSPTAGGDPIFPTAKFAGSDDNLPQTTAPDAVIFTEVDRTVISPSWSVDATTISEMLLRSSAGTQQPVPTARSPIPSNRPSRPPSPDRSNFAACSDATSCRRSMHRPTRLLPRR